MHVDVVNNFNLWIVLQSTFSSRAMEKHNHHSHSRFRKNLHMKGQAETTAGKREGNLKENRPENSQDRHHYPHLVPREAVRLSAGQAEVLKIHNNRILLQAEICLIEVNAKMPRVAPTAAIIPSVSTVGNLPVTVSWIEG